MFYPDAKYLPFHESPTAAPIFYHYQNEKQKNKLKMQFSECNDFVWATYSFISISTVGVNNCGPQKYFVLSTMRRPSKNRAVAENDLPNTSSTPAIIGGISPSTKPPITPNTVINKIGFKMIDFNASTINVLRFGPASFNSFGIPFAFST